MSRDDGFRNADLDVGFFDDPKVRALVRATRDEGLIARCLIAYLSTMVASWGKGQRVVLEDAAPLWLTGLEDIAARLVGVGLLDDDRLILEHSWDGWFGPAVERSIELKRKSIYGGLVSRGMSPHDANAEVERRLSVIRGRFNLEVQPIGSTSEAQPPSVPSVSTDRQAVQSRPTETAKPLDGAPAKAREPLNGFDQPTLKERTTTHPEMHRGGRPKAIGAVLNRIVPTEGPCQVCGGHVTDKEPCLVGPGWIAHAEHPKEWAS